MATRRRPAYDGGEVIWVPFRRSEVALAPKKSQKAGGKRARPDSGETRAADALTVAWMMSVLTTVVCGLIGGAIVLSTRGRAGLEGARLFGALLHFSAFVAAVVSLVLLACVLKFRQTPPPRAITWFAEIAAMVAIGTTFLY
jgi:hypothetical protein